MYSTHRATESSKPCSPVLDSNATGGFSAVSNWGTGPASFWRTSAIAAAAEA